MSEALTIRDFAAHLHNRFLVAQLEGYKLELTEVMDRSNAKLDQFSLIFTGTTTQGLPQGLYRLTHPQMGEHELFLVPIVSAKMADAGA